MNATGEYGQDCKDVIQAFNRHWCPEIFILETVDYATNLTNTNPLNQQWYALSQERLEKLLKTLEANIATTNNPNNATTSGPNNAARLGIKSLIEAILFWILTTALLKAAQDF